MTALPPAFLTTQQVLVLCGINNPTFVNGLIEDMLSYPKGIMHLQDEDSDGIQGIKNIQRRQRREETKKLDEERQIIRKFKELWQIYHHHS